METVKATDAKWLKVAFAELDANVRERPTKKNNNPRIIEYFAAIGHKEIKDDETAWCAAFVGFCFETVGIKSTLSAAAQSYRRWGKKVSKPIARGSVGIFKRGTEAWQGHVGFIIGVSPTHYTVLGGNQGNAVSIRKIPVEQLMEARWPASAGNSATIKAVAAGGALEFAPRLMESMTDIQSMAGELSQYWDYAQYVFSASSVVCLMLAIYFRYATIRDKGK